MKTLTAAVNMRMRLVKMFTASLNLFTEWLHMLTGLPGMRSRSRRR